MHKLNCMLMAAVGLWLLASATRAQDTNAPLTNLEVFETQTGVVIVRGTALIGTISAETGTVSIRCKESTEPGSGRREYGIAVDLKEGNRPEDTTIIDYDEMDSFLGGLDYLSKANHSVTPLSSFDALYRTGGGLRVDVSSGSKHPRAIQVKLQNSHAGRTRVVLSADQFAHFRNLVLQAKSRLDSLRADKQPGAPDAP